MKRDYQDVLVSPLLTEKLTAMRESGNKVGFVVRGNANRIEIKRAVESTLKVRVERVM
jgi:large subunit ribosomal protein L23